MPTLNTVVRNKSLVTLNSTQFANFEKFLPCWATLSKSFQTIEHRLLQENSANFAVNMESVISGQYRIILQRMEKQNASFKCSNVLLVRIPILFRTVLILPQQANSTQSPKFIVMFKNIVQYPILLPDGHHKNYFSNKRFE